MNDYDEFFKQPVIVVNPKYVFARVKDITVYLGGGGFLVCSCTKFSDYNGNCRHVELGRQLYAFEYSYSQTNGAGMFITRKDDSRKWFLSLDRLRPSDVILDIIGDEYTFINAFYSSSGEEIEIENNNAATMIYRGNAIETSIDSYRKARRIEIPNNKQEDDNC